MARCGAAGPLGGLTNRNESTMEKVIGVDLGTTNSCVSILEDDAPIVIPNRGGYKTTPSMVAIAENGKRLVGHIAKRQAITNAENTVHAAKRLIGRKWNAPAVKAAMDSVRPSITDCLVIGVAICRTGL